LSPSPKCHHHVGKWILSEKSGKVLEEEKRYEDDGR